MCILYIIYKTILSRGPGRQTAERDEVFDTWFVLQHKIQLWVLLVQKVHQVTHEVVDDICLITLS